MSKSNSELREIAILFANRIGSPWGEGATYSHSQAIPDHDADKPSANGKLNSHLDNEDFERFVDDLTKAITAHTNALLQEILESLPEKVADPHSLSNKVDIYEAMGRNDTIDEVETLLKARMK